MIFICFYLFRSLTNLMFLFPLVNLPLLFLPFLPLFKGKGCFLAPFPANYCAFYLYPLLSYIKYYGDDAIIYFHILKAS